ncbi:MAG: hypothetical protein HQM11_07680 [SAR324 cluster bacterium]|nr:hypothetical protein [SAR324 cluster bacterium]
MISDIKNGFQLNSKLEIQERVKSFYEGDETFAVVQSNVKCVFLHSQGVVLFITEKLISELDIEKKYQVIHNTKTYQVNSVTPVSNGERIIGYKIECAY